MALLWCNTNLTTRALKVSATLHRHVYSFAMATPSRPLHPNYPPDETDTKSTCGDEPRREAGFQDVDVLSIPTERTPQARPAVSLTRGCRELVERENGERVGSM